MGRTLPFGFTHIHSKELVRDWAVAVSLSQSTVGRVLFHGILPYKFIRSFNHCATTSRVKTGSYVARRYCAALCIPHASGTVRARILNTFLFPCDKMPHTLE